MAKHEAVDRLMALATEKRADRLPAGTSLAASEPATAGGGRAGREAAPSVESVTVSGNAPGVSVLAPSAEPPHASRADRGRQLLQSIRPLLPAVAGAMRLVDHGAVQALARLLPLLGGGPAGTQKPALSPEQEPVLQELQAAQRGTRQELDALGLRVTTAEEQLARTRTLLERMAAGQSARETELRALTDRVRLLSAALIILLMLIVAAMILAVVLLHR